jgi:hypothetical protein
VLGADFDSNHLTVGTLDALELAVTTRSGKPLGTLTILEAIIATDGGGRWEAVQLQTTFITTENGEERDSGEPVSSYQWGNVPLTVAAAVAFRDAEAIANAFGLRPIPPGVLALGLLSRSDTAAARALLAGDSTTHEQLLALVQDHVLGTHLEGLELILRSDGHAGASSSNTTSTAQFAHKPHSQPTAGLHPLPSLASKAPPVRKTNTKPHARKKSPSTFGFRVGTFIAAFLLAGVAGLQPFLALALALLIQQGAARSQKHHRLRALLPTAAALALLGAVVLAVTAKSEVSDDLAALHHLHTARHAIAAGKLPLATKELGAATLYENESVTLDTLSACTDWALGFKDYATFEAQIALNVGYRPGEESQYEGRSCFLDVMPFSGLGTMQVASLVWLIYPLPNQADEAGQQFLEIANRNRITDPALTMVALACLADHYDFRMTAAYLFTLGLNDNIAFGGGPLPNIPVRRCLSSRSVKEGYRFYVEPQTGDDVYIASDMAARIPSPTHPHPPVGACWVDFPAHKPCNPDD